jgi:hypothetical protein
VALCRSCVNRRFGGTYRLHLQSRKISERGTSMNRWLQSEQSEDGGDIFLRNVGSIYTASHPRRQHSSREMFIFFSKDSEMMNKVRSYLVSEEPSVRLLGYWELWHVTLWNKKQPKVLILIANNIPRFWDMRRSLERKRIIFRIGWLKPACWLAV